MNTFGADVLRLWVSSVDYSQDVSISDNILKQVSDAYRRIRNTFRFVLGNLDDFDFEKDAITDFEQLEPIDRYTMVQLADLVKEVEAAYEEYRFNGVYRAIYDFANDLSGVYLDETKDRLYAEAPNSPRRRAVQTVLMNVLEAMVRLVAPILSFTADEVWEHFPPAEREREERPFSVQLAGWPHVRDFVPTLPDVAEQEQLRADFATIMEVRDVVTKALEDARTDKVINTEPRGSHRHYSPCRNRRSAAGLRCRHARRAIHRGHRNHRRRERTGSPGIGSGRGEVPPLLEHSQAGRQSPPSGRM